MFEMGIDEAALQYRALESERRSQNVRGLGNGDSS